MDTLELLRRFGMGMKRISPVSDPLPACANSQGGDRFPCLSEKAVATPMKPQDTRCDTLEVGRRANAVVVKASNRCPLPHYAGKNSRTGVARV